MWFFFELINYLLIVFVELNMNYNSKQKIDLFAFGYLIEHNGGHSWLIL